MYIGIVHKNNACYLFVSEKKCVARVLLYFCCLTVPQVHAYVTGSPQSTVIVALEDKLLTTTLHCEPTINAPVIWFEKKSGQSLAEIQSSVHFLLERNGHALNILNYDVALNATVSFSCHLPNPSYNSATISVATFNIVTLPGKFLNRVSGYVYRKINVSVATLI